MKYTKPQSNEWVREGRDPIIFWKRLGHTKALIGDFAGAKHAYMTLDGNPSDKECWRSLEFTFEERGDYVGADEVRCRGEARVGM